MKYNLKAELESRGFIPVADPYGFAAPGQIIEKTYEQEFGTKKCTFTVNVRFTSDYEGLTVSYSQYGSRKPFKVKSHAANRRAFNAIADTLFHNGLVI